MVPIFLGSALLISVGILGAVLLLALGTVLLQAGCALANVQEPGPLKALLLFTLSAILSVPLVGALYWYAGSLDPDPTKMLGPARGVALAAGVVLTLVLSALVFMGGLRVRPLKGLVVAGSELVLLGLVGSLLSGVVLVGLSIAQIFFQQPPPTKLGMELPAPMDQAARERT